MLKPGDRITLPHAPDWGTGQVQSVTGHRVTANFEHAGKRTLDLRHAAVDRLGAEGRRHGS